MRAPVQGWEGEAREIHRTFQSTSSKECWWLLGEKGGVSPSLSSANAQPGIHSLFLPAEGNCFEDWLQARLFASTCASFHAAKVCSQGTCWDLPSGDERAALREKNQGTYWVVQALWKETTDGGLGAQGSWRFCMWNHVQLGAEGGYMWELGVWDLEMWEA